MSLVNMEAARLYVVLLASSITSEHALSVGRHNSGVIKVICTLLSLELEDTCDWSKDLFLDDLHVWLTFGEDGQVDKIPLVPNSVPGDWWQWVGYRDTGLRAEEWQWGAISGW